MFDAKQAIEKMGAAGMTLAVEGDRLVLDYQIPPTNGQCQWIKDHKPELVAELKAREGIAETVPEFGGQTASTPEPVYHGFTLANLQAKAHPDEWAEVRDNPEALRIFALSLLEGRQMAACVVPERFTKLARCNMCGVVHVPSTWTTERVKHDLGLYGADAWDECPICPWCRQRNQGRDYPKPCPTDRDGKRWPRPIAWQGVDERGTAKTDGSTV